MARDKQIEEMAEDLWEYSRTRDDDAIALGESLAEYLIEEKGYRKQSEGEWVSVNDRLPDRAGKYLVATFDGQVGIGNLLDYYCDGDLSFDNYKVTHWMPLPKPPKMKGE